MLTSSLSLRRGFLAKCLITTCFNVKNDSTHSAAIDVRGGSGVVFAVAGSLVSSPVIVACELEIVWVCVSFIHKQIITCVYHRLPTSSCSFVNL